MMQFEAKSMENFKNFENSAQLLLSYTVEIIDTFYIAIESKTGRRSS